MAHVESTPRSPRPPAGVALFAWVKQELLDSIARGEFSLDQPFITQREIVKRFGVSTTTAVRALNELVAAGVVVRRRGRGTFVTRPPAAGEPALPAPFGAQRVIAYVSPDIRGTHDSELLAGLAAESAQHGYRVVVEHTRGPADEEPVLSRLAAGGIHGVVFFPHDRSTAAGAVAQLRRRGVAVVLVDRYLPGCPTDAVLFDDLGIGYEVTAAMLDRGHHAPAMFWSEVDVTSVRDRLAGHLRALREHRQPELPERCALRAYDPNDQPGRRQLLSSVLATAPRPTGIICANAMTLALVVSDLLATDTSFPGSLELATMDQFWPYDISPFAVVWARLPTRRMGQEAGRMLHARLAGTADPLRHKVIPASVQIADRGQNTLAVVSTAR